MASPPASVIVVSRGRPEALDLCLKALALQDHPQFEVIVVADPAGLAVAGRHPVRLVAFDEANISAARNAGLRLAAGEVVAFIDDDAVAEPTWLSRLVAPFADPSVDAATGFVCGRNGISLQWAAARIDRSGLDHPLDAGAGGLFDPDATGPVKTQGTTCAFRASALRAAGGFDPAFRFYLDEADVNLRMQARTAVVPKAQVAHGFAASDRRRADRVPLTLADIGASTACFLRRHAPDADLPAAFSALAGAQAARLAAHRKAGRLNAADVARLMDSLSGGWADGLTRPLGPLPPIPAPAGGFEPLPGTGPRPGRVIAGRIWQARRLRAEAERAAREGQIVTLFLFSPTPRKHRMRFDPAGFWEQTGGLFGASLRSQPLFRLWTFPERLAHETERVGRLRPTGRFSPPPSVV